jgi:phosphoribosylaminoimidazolecarboxamide formyltransferase/IMP cyclohydrolase
MNIAVFVSGGGTNLQAIIDQIGSGHLPGVKIVKVIASRDHIYAIERAKRSGIPFRVISKKDYPDIGEYDSVLISEMKSAKVDLVVLAGFLSLLGTRFIREYSGRIINVHPSLIPSFCGEGMYGIMPHKAALAAGVRMTGATVHFVDEQYDTGPIILQKTVDVHEGDSPETLQARVMEEAERIILPASIRLIAEKAIRIVNGKVITDLTGGKKMSRAIISVSDKAGIVELAKELVSLGIEIISTGGTASLLAKEGVNVRQVAEITGFPECLDGRVKTLHPKIHGGILAIRDNKEHMETLEKLDITPIDYIIINLYPFKATVMNPDSTFEECIENIDIGGPSMLRAAAKNHHDVTVVTDPADYSKVIDEIKNIGATTKETRLYLAGKVFSHTAAYDTLIANYLATQIPGVRFPSKLSMTYEKVSQMRYGENPHQQACFYKNAIPCEGTLSEAVQFGGKELSYNNIADTDACIALLKEFTEPTVVAVKHANPCGVGSAKDIRDAWKKAFEADKVSIYGGIVAANRDIDAATAAGMAEIFLEVIVAPSYTNEALDILLTKKNLRVLQLPKVGEPVRAGEIDIKKVLGGILVQDYNSDTPSRDDWETVTEENVDNEYADDLLFAMKVVKHVKSNAIVLVKNKQTVGIGPGQPNRITSTRIAIENAGSDAEGSVLASDAFFPFSDCVEEAAAAGIKAIIQPGGSMRDEESIAACNKHRIPMIFTGKRHFKH